MGDPEAEGFGRKRGRGRLELAFVVLLVVGLPVVAIVSVRALAEMAAMRLPPELDARFGEPTWLGIKASGQLCQSPGPVRYVEQVAEPLLEALGKTPYTFRFAVARSDAVNAFALPGGFVVVNMGLLKASETGGEVAAVLAHELSHVTERHGTRRLAGQLGLGAALAIVFGTLDVAAPAQSLSALANLSYDREQEREADRRALALLKRADLSPASLGVFFDRLAAEARPPELLSTHPDPGGRAQRARSAALGVVASRELSGPQGLHCDDP
jgi:predicted Zn-dependent protease